MQLDVLAGGDVGVAVAEQLAVVGALRERVGDHPDLAELVGAFSCPPGNLDPQHEGVTALALGVEADPLQPLDLAGSRVDGGRALDRVAW